MTDFEQILDARIQRRLATDSAYRYAETIEEQAEREDEISEQEYNKLARGYEYNEPHCRAGLTEY